MGDFEFHPVTAERWSALADFFRANGNPNYCWCMRWRLSSKDFAADDAAGRRNKLEKLVQEKTPVGVLAYHEGTAVGWCSIAPRETYSALEKSRVLPRLDEQPVWSVVCFFVDRQFRQQGLASQLLTAAVEYARSQGATIVEGYPIELGKSYQFMGAPAVFEKVGFQEAGTGKNGRKIVRLNTHES
jgi:GNAT superfamily N-acetyltransferase